MSVSVMSGNFDDESQGSRLARKTKEAPYFPIGIVGLLVACGIGAYKYKYRGKMSTSIYLMQLRVAAQSAVVGTLTLGLAYTMAKEYLFKNKSEEKPQ